MSVVLTVMAAAAALALSALALSSVREHEPLAARRATLLAVAVPLVLLAAAWIPVPGSGVVRWILALLGLGVPLVLAVPTGRPRDFARHDPPGRIDERCVMFSRAKLEPGTDRFREYYRLHPEHRTPDDNFRRLPGLLSPGGSKAEPLAFAAAGASFTAVERLADLVEGEPAPERVDADPETLTRFVRGWALKLGAADCGVTELRAEHLYSVKGRGAHWGEEVHLAHRWAVALTVEMDHRMLQAAPDAPTVMESAQQYLAAGAIAVQIAVALRALGWPAEAHIDAHYKVVCPLVARDAGLGEIGRMGLLMTPRLGPRVRIAVVTTEAPLLPSAPAFDPTVLDFCTLCEKCARVCPTQAIPSGPMEVVDGVPRWKIDQEACYTFWCATGTDCGRCVRACPYSHPDSFLHNLVRAGTRNSALFRRVALWLDDLFYGRRPRPSPPPGWLPAGQVNSERRPIPPTR